MSGESLTSYKTEIDGCFYISFNKFPDRRGYFHEVYKESVYKLYNLPTSWAQDNFSYSKKNVLRGLHIQSKNPQGKLVTCFGGSITDVCLDLRKDSPSYLKHVIRDVYEGKALYCPPGTAHGFYVNSKEAYVYYKCTTPYDPESDGGVYWADQELGIDWPKINPLTSPKDACLPKLSDYLKARE